MIILRNYSEEGTYIMIEDDEYNIVSEKEIESTRQGIVGFSENEDLIGVYLKGKDLYFIYNSKSYKFNSDTINFENNVINKEKRNFIVKINEKEVCAIEYKRVFFVFSLGEEEDEFDYLLYLSNLFQTKEDIERFSLSVEKLNQ